MHATLTLDSSLTRTTLLLPPRPHSRSSEVNVCSDDADSPPLPAFTCRSRSAGTHPPLTVTFLRRTIRTCHALRDDFKQIVSAGSSPDAQALLACSIPARTAEFSDDAEGTSSLLVVAHHDDDRHSARIVSRKTHGAPLSILQGLVERSRVRKPLLALAASTSTRPLSPALGTSSYLIDARSTSCSAVSLYKEKLFHQIDAALPEALLHPDGLESMKRHDGSGGPALALPDNILLPCANRNPECVYAPAGVSAVVAATRAVRPASPVEHVRRLQQQTQLEVAPHAGVDTQSKITLRPRSVDVLVGHGLPAKAYIGAPTESTRAARRNVARAREYIESQQIAAADSFASAQQRKPSLGRSAGSSGPSDVAGLKPLEFRARIVRKSFNR